jgi:hypothetical protein
MAAKRASEKTTSPRVFGHARKPPKMFRAGLYARVSTNDQQTIPLQIRALREYTIRRGWTIALQVKEVGSSASQRQLREKLLEAPRRREIDVVLVWRLDRWGRSVADLLATLQELEHLGVGFVSLTEALDLTIPAPVAPWLHYLLYSRSSKEKFYGNACAPAWPTPDRTQPTRTSAAPTGKLRPFAVRTATEKLVVAVSGGAVATLASFPPLSTPASTDQVEPAAHTRIFL